MDKDIINRNKIILSLFLLVLYLFFLLNPSPLLQMPIMDWSLWRNIFPRINSALIRAILPITWFILGYIFVKILDTKTKSVSNNILFLTLFWFSLPIGVFFMRVPSIRLIALIFILPFLILKPQSIYKKDNASFIGFLVAVAIRIDPALFLFLPKLYWNWQNKKIRNQIVKFAGWLIFFLTILYPFPFYKLNPPNVWNSASLININNAYAWLLPMILLITVSKNIFLKIKKKRLKAHTKQDIVLIILSLVVFSIKQIQHSPPDTYLYLLPALIVSLSDFLKYFAKYRKIILIILIISNLPFSRLSWMSTQHIWPQTVQQIFYKTQKNYLSFKNYSNINPQVNELILNNKFDLFKKSDKPTGIILTSSLLPTYIYQDYFKSLIPPEKFLTNKKIIWESNDNDPYFPFLISTTKEQVRIYLISQ